MTIFVHFDACEAWAMGCYWRFNNILSAEEKDSGAVPSQSSMLGFRDTFES